MSYRARTRSVHLMYSNDRKLGLKGGARMYPKQDHPVLQGRPFSIKIRLTTECPRTLPLNTAQPRLHQNAHDDVNATPPYPQHNGMTHFLGGWSNTTSTQSPTLHMQTGNPPAGHCLQLYLGPHAITRVWMG